MLDIQNILKIKCNAELSMFLSGSVPWNPSLKLPVYLGQKKLLHYVNILRTTLGGNVAFQQFFSLIKFHGKEFQNRRRKKKKVFLKDVLSCGHRAGVTDDLRKFVFLETASCFLLRVAWDPWLQSRPKRNWTSLNHMEIKTTNSLLWAPFGEEHTYRFF